MIAPVRASRAAERRAGLRREPAQEHAAERGRVPGRGRHGERRVAVVVERERRTARVGRRDEVAGLRGHGRDHGERAGGAGRAAREQLRGEPADRTAGAHRPGALGREVAAAPAMQLAREHLHQRHLALDGDGERARDVRLAPGVLVQLADQELRPADQADPLLLPGRRQARRHVGARARELDADVRQLQALRAAVTGLAELRLEQQPADRRRDRAAAGGGVERALRRQRPTGPDAVDPVEVDRPPGQRRDGDAVAFEPVRERARVAPLLALEVDDHPRGGDRGRSGERGGSAERQEHRGEAGPAHDGLMAAVHR